MRDKLNSSTRSSKRKKSEEMIIEIIALIFTGFSAIFAGVGLVLNKNAIKESNKTRQIQLLTDCFKDIKETEYKLYKDYKGKDSRTKREWDSLHFNSVEYLSFLINEKFIGNKKMVGFFDDAIIIWYEQMFIKHFSSDEVNNNQLYPEFKKLYHKIKLRQVCRKK